MSLEARITPLKKNELQAYARKFTIEEGRDDITPQHLSLEISQTKILEYPHLTLTQLDDSLAPWVAVTNPRTRLSTEATWDEIFLLVQVARYAAHDHQLTRRLTLETIKGMDERMKQLNEEIKGIRTMLQYVK